MTKYTDAHDMLSDDRLHLVRFACSRAVPRYRPMNCGRSTLPAANRGLAETPGYTCGSPDWSPDGKLVAYDTWRSRPNLQ